MNQTTMTVDAVAQEIRRVDGNHNLGAGALAEKLMPFLSAMGAAGREDEAVATVSIGQRPDALGSRLTFTRLTVVGQALPAGKYHLFIAPPDQRATPTELMVRLRQRFHALRPVDTGGTVEDWIAYANEAHAALEGVLGEPAVVRPCEDAARSVIKAFLAEKFGEVPAFGLAEHGEPAQGNQCGWAFWLTEDGCHGNTFSYVRANLRIDWHGNDGELPTIR